MGNVITGKQVAAVLRKARSAWHKHPGWFGIRVESAGSVLLAIAAWEALDAVSGLEASTLLRQPPAFIEDAFAAAIELANG